MKIEFEFCAKRVIKELALGALFGGVAAFLVVQVIERFLA